MYCRILFVEYSRHLFRSRHDHNVWRHSDGIYNEFTQSTLDHIEFHCLHQTVRLGQNRKTSWTCKFGHSGHFAALLSVSFLLYCLIFPLVSSDISPSLSLTLLCQGYFWGCAITALGIGCNMRASILKRRAAAASTPSALSTTKFVPLSGSPLPAMASPISSSSSAAALSSSPDNDLDSAIELRPLMASIEQSPMPSPTLPLSPRDFQRFRDDVSSDVAIDTHRLMNTLNNRHSPSGSGSGSSSSTSSSFSHVSQSSAIRASPSVDDGDYVYCDGTDAELEGDGHNSIVNITTSIYGRDPVASLRRSPDKLP